MMKRAEFRYLVFQPILILLLFTGCVNSNSDIRREGESKKENQIESSLVDSTVHNYVDKKRILIKDSETAIKVIEPILFSIYGEEEIKSQKPYSHRFVDNQWHISGSLRDDYIGGVFLIVIDARNCEILRITHGK